MWLSFLLLVPVPAQEKSQSFFSQIVEEAPSSRAAPSSSSKLAKFEPERGCYLGAYIDLDPDMKQEFIDQSGKRRRLPEEFESNVGRPHAIYFFYLGYGQPLPSDWISYLDSRQKYVHIALEPNGGLEQVVEDDYLRNLAVGLRMTGARIFIRFASEMNGPWVRYHGDPKLYREKFRLVARVMHELAPNVAMVWCPYAMPTGPIRDYYPGDDAVDWVGVNLYNVTYFNQDPRTPAHHVEPDHLLSYVYRTYSARKPIMIGEYATTHFSALENRYVISFATENIQRLYRLLPIRFPRVKAIHYFNSNNLQLAHRVNNDYRVTSDPKVLAAYQSAISGPYFLSQPQSPAMPPSNIKATPLGDRLELRTVSRIRADFSPRPQVVARFLLNDQVIPSQSSPTGYTTTLFPARLRSGEHKLVFEAFDLMGQTIERRILIVSLP